MNCRECSKIIPDGFTDCPWCGAQFGAPGISRPATGELPVSSGHNLLITVSIVSSAVLFCVLNYFAATRADGSLTLENSGYFLGRCVGSLLLGAIVLLGYCKVRETKLRGPVQVLVSLTLASLFTLLTLALPSQPRQSGINSATIRRSNPDTVNGPIASNPPPVEPTKWDPAVRSLMKDIATRNQQYVSEISSLDQTAKPLYTLESFRDAAAIQQMIDQLRERQAVADKFADWQPIFSRMKGYVAAVDANEDEKRNFLQQYEATLPNTLAVCKVISDKEHAWLHASLELYQFALSKDATYTWQTDHLAFQNRSDSDSFRKKFVRARASNEDFLKAYWEVRRAQDEMMAQLGLPNQDLGPAQTQ